MYCDLYWFVHREHAAFLHASSLHEMSQACLEPFSLILCKSILEASLEWYVSARHFAICLPMLSCRSRAVTWVLDAGWPTTGVTWHLAALKGHALAWRHSALKRRRASDYLRRPVISDFKLRRWRRKNAILQITAIVKSHHDYSAGFQISLRHIANLVIMRCRRIINQAFEITTAAPVPSGDWLPDIPAISVDSQASWSNESRHAGRCSLQSILSTRVCTSSPGAACTGEEVVVSSRHDEAKVMPIVTPLGRELDFMRRRAIAIDASSPYLNWLWRHRAAVARNDSENSLCQRVKIFSFARWCCS